MTDRSIGEVLTLAAAAVYLGMSPRALYDRPDIPRHDVRAPGTHKAQWRFLRRELDAWIASRGYGGYERGAA